MKNDYNPPMSLHKPSRIEELFFFASGLLMSVPFTVFFSQLSNLLCLAVPLLVAQVCSSVIFAPFTEEFAKVFPLFYRHGETERSTLNLGILVGLGFGFTEFLIYVFSLGAPVISRVPGIFFHASSAGIVAYGLAKKTPLPYYFVAVFLHLVNNLFALFPSPLAYITAPSVLLATYFLSWHLYRRSSERIIV